MHPRTLQPASSLNPLTTTPSCLTFQNPKSKPTMCMNWKFSHTCTQIPWNPTWNTWKVATVQSRTPPPLLQPIIHQAVLEDTYIDDWGFGAKSITELSEKQQEIESFLNKGGFHINSWEHSGENGSSKYLGMTLDCRQDCYLLKFHLNLHKKKLVKYLQGTTTIPNFSKTILHLSQRKMSSIPLSNRSCSSTAALCTITIQWIMPQSYLFLQLHPIWRTNCKILQRSQCNSADQGYLFCKANNI